MRCDCEEWRMRKDYVRVAGDQQFKYCPWCSVRLQKERFKVTIMYDDIPRDCVKDTTSG